MNTAIHDISASFDNSAWLQCRINSAVIDGGRPFVVVPAAVNRVWTENCPDDLPCSAAWTDSSGCMWKRFEIPALAESRISEDHDIGNETTRVVFSTAASRDRHLELTQYERLPQSACSSVEDMIDRHIDVITSLFDSPSTKNCQWQGNAQSVAFRSCDDLISRWHESAASNEPRMALIVRLARSLPDLLSAVCQRPRHTLKRERQLLPLGRIQEVDSGCLRWLARQPGETVAEKAGTKQTAMAVVRVEDIDTPENRVVRDLLARGLMACERYLREYRSASDHPRVLVVNRFQHCLRQLAVDTPICRAKRLVGVPQPNYVLQHDPRYQTLWQAYLQLVRQQMLEDNVWRWRHRLFAEHVRICAIAALTMLTSGQTAQTGDVLLRLEQTAGQFIDPRTTLGGWSIPGESQGSIDFVFGRQLHLYPLIPAHIAALAPDLVLVRRSACDDPWIAAVWCLLDFDPRQDTFDDRFLSLAECLNESGKKGPDRGLLIQPCLQEHNQQIAGFEELDPLRGLRIGLPLQHHFGQMVEQIRWALKLT